MITETTFRKKYAGASSDAYFTVADAVEAAMRGASYQVPKRYERFVVAFLTAYHDATGEEIASMAHAMGQRRYFGQSAFL